jgi:hypothetical protein
MIEPTPRTVSFPFDQPISASTHAPRDGETLETTRDIPFLAALFRTCVRRGARRIIITEVESGPSPWYAYHSGEPWIRPVTGLEVPIMMNILFRTHEPQVLIERIRVGLWETRIQLATETTATIKVGSETITNDGARTRHGLSRLNKRLRWPIIIGDDVLAHGNLTSLPWEGLDASVAPPPGHAICPLDGVVEAVEMTYSSNSWTWEHLCGRQYKLLACPKCLAEFEVDLTIMN